MVGCFGEPSRSDWMSAFKKSIAYVLFCYLSCSSVSLLVFLHSSCFYWCLPTEHLLSRKGKWVTITRTQFKSLQDALASSNYRRRAGICVLKAFGSLGDFCLIIVLSGQIFLKTYRGLFSHQIKYVFIILTEKDISLTQIFSGNYESWATIQHGWLFSLVCLYFPVKNIVFFFDLETERLPTQLAEEKTGPDSSGLDSWCRWSFL